MLSLGKSSLGFFFCLFVGHVIGSAYLELGKLHRFNIGLQFIISEHLSLYMSGQCFIAFLSQEVSIQYPDLHRAYKERSVKPVFLRFYS